MTHFKLKKFLKKLLSCRYKKALMKNLSDSHSLYLAGSLLIRSFLILKPQADRLYHGISKNQSTVALLGNL